MQFIGHVKNYTVPLGKIEYEFGSHVSLGSTHLGVGSTPMCGPNSFTTLPKGIECLLFK